MHIPDFPAVLRWSAIACTVLLCGQASNAATLVVNVVGIQTEAGFVGCALFAAEASTAFPLDTSRATTKRASARPGTVQCTFEGLSAGSYAVSAAHDRNGNGKTDRNLLGLPVEPWAVSNNVRPTLRAPRFSESALTLTGDETRQIELQLSQ
jgi:uncharacterized protein (DUF2141 family)